MTLKRTEEGLDWLQRLQAVWSAIPEGWKTAIYSSLGFVITKLIGAISPVTPVQAWVYAVAVGAIVLLVRYALRQNFHQSTPTADDSLDTQGANAGRDAMSRPSKQEALKPATPPQAVGAPPEESDSRKELSLTPHLDGTAVISLRVVNETTGGLDSVKVLVRNAQLWSERDGALIDTPETHSGHGYTFRSVYLDADSKERLFAHRKRFFYLTCLINGRLTINGRPPGQPESQLPITLKAKGEWHVTLEITHGNKSRSELIRFHWDGSQVSKLTLIDQPSVSEPVARLPAEPIKAPATIRPEGKLVQARALVDGIVGDAFDSPKSARFLDPKEYLARRLAERMFDPKDVSLEWRVLDGGALAVNVMTAKVEGLRNFQLTVTALHQYAAITGQFGNTREFADMVEATLNGPQDIFPNEPGMFHLLSDGRSEAVRFQGVQGGQLRDIAIRGAGKWKVFFRAATKTQSGNRELCFEFEPGNGVRPIDCRPRPVYAPTIVPTAFPSPTTR